MANGARVAGRGRGVLCLVVLAAAALARVSRGNGGRGALAMAGSVSVSAGVRCCPALRLGLRVDGTGHACSARSAEAVGRAGFLPPCAEPDVLGFRGGVDRRALGRVRARQRGSDCCRGSGRPRRASVRRLL